MSRRRDRPPALGRWLAAALAPDHAREEIVGDLDELWAARPRRALAARVYYWRQALSLVWWARRAPRSVRARVPSRAAWLAHVVADLRFAGRLSRRQPAYSLMTIGTLALGIAAATAIFTICHRVLLQPLPYADPDRIVVLDNVGFAFTTLGMRPPRAVQELRELDAVGLYASGGLNFGAESSPDRLQATAVTSGFFPALGAVPMLGRATDATDDAASAQVAVISFDLWRSRFGSDRGVIGRDIRLNSATFTILGVMPVGFAFPAGTAVWIPVGADAQITGSAFAPTMVARLARGVSPAQAVAALERAVARPGNGDRDRPIVTHLQEELVGGVRPNLVFLAVLVGLLLAATSASVAGLLLSRLTVRRRELLVRAALGATSGRLVRQLLTEAAAIAGVGSLAGLVLALWVIRLFAASVPTFAPHVDLTSVRLDVFLLGAAVSLVSVVLFGLGPALSARRTTVASVLREGASPGRRARHGGQLLVVVQIGAALVLLAGASTALALVMRLNRVDLGFTNGRAVIFELTLPNARYRTAAANAALVQQFEARIRQQPAVRAAGATSFAPGSAQTGVGMRLRRPHETAAVSDERPSASLLTASPDFFRALGIRLIAGRTFTDADSAASRPVVIVSEGAARTIVERPADAVGLRVIDPWSRTPREYEIVGVVADARFRGRLTNTQAQIYQPIAQSVMLAGALGVVVDADGDRASVIALARRVLAELDPELPIYNIVRVSDIRARYLATERLTLMLTVAFSTLALLLAAVGLYGVLSQVVSQRRREMGIRMALGADRAKLTAGVVGSSMKFALLGAAAGAGVVLLGARSLSAVLPSFVRPDPWMLAGNVAILIAVAALAAWEPARRAARVDPLIALRTE